MLLKTSGISFFVLGFLVHFALGKLANLENSTKNSYISSCKDTTQHGVQTIRLDAESRAFEVFCDQKTYRANGGWTLILKRATGEIDFTQRALPDFKFGFGNFSGDFFIGLDKLNALTSFENYELRIVMRDFENLEYTTTFASFTVADETYQYSTGDMATGARGIDVGFTKWNAFCTSSSKSLCEHLVPGWQPNPAFKHPKALLQMFGVYPEMANDNRASVMGLYLYNTEQSRPLRSIKMLIAPTKLSIRFPAYARNETKYDQRFFPSLLNYSIKKHKEFIEEF